MKKGKIQIGELAKLMGIAPETIRYYEKKNIITPQRGKDNQYRLFSEKDIYEVNRIRNYLHYNFSLKEIEDMLCMPEIETTQLRLMVKANDLEQQIAEEMALLNSIHQRLLHIQKVITNQNKVVQTKSEALYYIKITDGGECRIKIENENAIRWAGKQHFSYPFSIINYQSYDNCKYQLQTTGLSVTVAEVEKARVTIPESAFLIESKSILYTTVIYREDHPADEIYSGLKNYLQKFPTKVGKEVYIKVIATQRAGDVNVHYMEVWVPIEEMNV